MSSDFCKLSDIANVQGGFAFKSADFSDSGVAVVKIANIQPPLVSLVGVDRIPHEKLKGLERFELHDGDVLMAMTGATVGKVGRFRRTEPAYLNQRVARISAIKGREFDDFVYAVVSLPGFDKLIEGASAGSAQANISAAGIGSVAIRHISDDEQIQIGSVARTLDDRIALLRETNATLEAIAQALFKSWFVDFDPVHANGTQSPSLPPDIQALFPATFTDSPQGPIPDGWKVGTVGEVIETLGGATPDTKNEEFWYPSEIAWTSPKDLSGLNTPVILATERRISQKGLGKISSGLLPKGTLLMSSRAPIGYLAIAQIPLAINQGYIAMPPGGYLPPLYMLFWCRTNMELIENRANGSTFMEISKKAFKPIELIVPPIEIIDQFMSNATPLFEKLIENEQQAQNLESLRDSLLPRLISGQMRLPEAEQAVAAITD